MTWLRATATAGSAVVKLACCRIRIVPGHREPPETAELADTLAGGSMGRETVRSLVFFWHFLSVAKRQAPKRADCLFSVAPSANCGSATAIWLKGRNESTCGQQSPFSRNAFENVTPPRFKSNPCARHQVSDSARNQNLTCRCK